MAKRFGRVQFRVTDHMSDIIVKTFSEVRRKSKKPRASDSQINRAFWLAITLDKKLRENVMKAVCKFLEVYDTNV